MGAITFWTLLIVSASAALHWSTWLRNKKRTGN